MEKQISKGILGFAPLFEKGFCLTVTFGTDLPFYKSYTFLNIYTIPAWMKDG